MKRPEIRFSIALVVLEMIINIVLLIAGKYTFEALKQITLICAFGVGTIIASTQLLELYARIKNRKK